MEKQKKVVDASVLAKLFLDEPGKEAALRLKSEHLSNAVTLIVPELLFLEVLNTLRYKYQSAPVLSKVNAALFDLQLVIKNIDFSLIEKSIENSIKHNITIYDAVYVALAEIEGCELVTADKELYKIPNVVPLEKV
jgi:predicted nucleic acid-binding protein